MFSGNVTVASHPHNFISKWYTKIDKEVDKEEINAALDKSINTCLLTHYGILLGIVKVDLTSPRAQAVFINWLCFEVAVSKDLDVES